MIEREAIASGVALAAVGLGGGETAATASGGVRIRRLGWAGIEIECDDQTLLIDYVRETQGSRQDA